MLKILFVEDNPGDVVLVRELLISSGLQYEIIQASSLKESLMLCIEQTFDVILVDLGLPDSYGLDTLKRINPFNERSPLIVMTGLDDEEVALEALREGAQDYLVKSRLNTDTILRSIKYSIERKRIQDLQRQYTQRFTILSSSTAALNENDDIPESFKIICANIGLLLHKARAMAFDFSEEGKIRVSGLDWLLPWFDQIKLLTGWDLNKPVFPITRTQKALFSDNYGPRLTSVQGGLFEVFNGFVPEMASKKLEHLFSINHIYVTGFIQHKIFYGGLMVFSQVPVTDEDISIIEAISNQTSLNIHKRTIEKDLRLSENRYRKLNEELEKKVKERTRDLEKLNHQLKDLNATKDKFFNIVAHDLKNPFTSLLGSSELLFQNIENLDTDSIRKLATILNDSAKSGYAILQNLLDWSRSQTGMLKFNPETLNISSLIRENIINLELFANNKEITVELEALENLQIYADKNMINTILRNLLSNAIKFSYRKGKVLVKTIQDQDEVMITITDEGTGIPAENIKKLFRIDAKYSLPGTENEQGTGLGLKLCKEFVEKQGGRIWVKSREKHGSEFGFSIKIPHNGLNEDSAAPNP